MLKNDLIGIWEKDSEYSRQVFSGMRPTFLIKEDYLTSGRIELTSGKIELTSDKSECKDPLNDGDLVTVQFISPELYPNSLWEGKKIDAFDGSKRMGTLTVQEVINPILAGSAVGRN